MAPHTLRPPTRSVLLQFIAWACQWSTYGDVDDAVLNLATAMRVDASHFTPSSEARYANPIWLSPLIEDVVETAAALFTTGSYTVWASRALRCLVLSLRSARESAGTGAVLHNVIACSPSGKWRVRWAGLTDGDIHDLESPYGATKAPSLCAGPAYISLSSLVFHVGGAAGGHPRSALYRHELSGYTCAARCSGTSAEAAGGAAASASVAEAVATAGGAAASALDAAGALLTSSATAKHCDDAAVMSRRAGPMNRQRVTWAEDISGGGDCATDWCSAADVAQSCAAPGQSVLPGSLALRLGDRQTSSLTSQAVILAPAAVPARVAGIYGPRVTACGLSSDDDAMNEAALMSIGSDAAGGEKLEPGCITTRPTALMDNSASTTSFAPRQASTWEAPSPLNEIWPSALEGAGEGIGAAPVVLPRYTTPQSCEGDLAVSLRDVRIDIPTTAVIRGGRLAGQVEEPAALSSELLRQKTETEAAAAAWRALIQAPLPPSPPPT